MTTRLTVRLDEALARELKKRAFRESRSVNRSVNQLVNQLLKRALADERVGESSRPPRFRQKTRHMGKPRVPIVHALAPSAQLEDEELTRKLGVERIVRS